jgi:hypothetical protein
MRVDRCVRHIDPSGLRTTQHAYDTSGLCTQGRLLAAPLQGRRLLFKKEERNYSAFRARWGAKLRASVSPAR